MDCPVKTVISDDPSVCFLAVLNLDNNIVDMETLQALYENVSCWQENAWIQVMTAC